MGFALDPAISFCRVGDRLVFLDCAADRYFCLSEQDQRSFMALAFDAGQVAADEEGAHLEALGLGNAVPGDLRPVPCRVPLPAGSFGPVSLPVWQQMGKGGRLRLRLDLLWTRWRIAHWPLSAILEPLARSFAGIIASPRTVERARPVVAAFEAASHVTARNGDCLARSICLASTLAEADVRPTLVFGVKLDPFAAHCWVQIGSLLLCDDVDAVRPYTPILAL